MLGSSLATELSRSHKVFGTGSKLLNLPFNYKAFDLSSPSFKELIDWSKPEIIIHCAALTNGNYCQNNPLQAFDINGCAVRKFLDVIDSKTKFIYISTDAVFPSNLSCAKEYDCTSPESVYGKSKEIGEFFLLNSDLDFVIIRTTIVGLNLYTDNKGFLEWMIDSAKTKTSINLFKDVYFNPISIWDLSTEINHIITANQYNHKILHISGSEKCTKYDFGMQLLNTLSLDTSTVRKGYISDFKDRAKRSNDQTISTSFYEKSFERGLPNISKTIKSIKHKYFEIN
jgi:dTDP-4-dehydrorhamnose reductase